MSVTTKYNLQFLKQIVLTLAIVGALGVYPMVAFATQEIQHGVTAGVALSIVNVLFGYAAIEFSSNVSFSHFVQIVLGGIAVRLIIIAGSLLLMIMFLKIHTISLVCSFFGMYVIFLALEVLYIHNTWSKTRLVEQEKIDLQH